MGLRKVFSFTIQACPRDKGTSTSSTMGAGIVGCASKRDWPTFGRAEADSRHRRSKGVQIQTFMASVPIRRQNKKKKSGRDDQEGSCWPKKTCPSQAGRIASAILDIQEGLNYSRDRQKRQQAQADKKPYPRFQTTWMAAAGRHRKPGPAFKQGSEARTADQGYPGEPRFAFREKG